MNMNAIERKFLLAVERGDISNLKILLSSERRHLDINCCDPLARNALVIAIDNENLEIVKILLEAGIKVGDALLYAIDENFVEAVEILLDHEQATGNSGCSPSWEQDREYSFFSADMTPIILAAHRNNFEIIKILLDRRVSTLPDPHEPQCACNVCHQARAQDCLKHSRSRINAYRALASPCLMALSSPDPLLTAFEMSARLEKLATMEPEYKEDYLRLRAQCQTFATRLLDYTRTSKELEILLNYSDKKETEESICDMSLRTSTSSLDVTSIHLEPNFNMILSKKDSMLSLDSVTGRHESYRSDMRLARLRLAIQCKQKTFCAHPNIQELLATMWYENLPGFRNKNPIAQILQVIMIGIMFPIYSVAYLIAPHSKLGRYIKKPFIKFICHSASYITFLIVLILASQRVEVFYSWGSVVDLFSDAKVPAIVASTNITINRPIPTPIHESEESEIEALAALYKEGVAQGGSKARGWESLSKIFEPSPASAKKRGTPPSPIEVVILIWVVSLIWAEIKQVRILGMNYYKADMWNILDSVASGFYIATIILRIISYIQSDAASCEVARELWHAYDPTLLSEGLFAAATIFSALKLVYIFSVNPYLGPLQISLGRMIIDILRFSWIYMLVLFSFACGMNQLLWYYADLEWHQCLNVTMDDSCKTWRHFSNVFESTQTLFWATFGLVDLENFDLTGIKQYTRFWALLMFGCYCFINVIVVINLLIAMMNHSYVKIWKKSDVEWKFARTRLWMSYFDTGSTVPAPFNIIPSFKSIIQFGRRHPSKKRSLRDRHCERELTATYRSVVRTLVRRYLVKEQRLLEKKRELTEAKLNRWAKLNAFNRE